MKKTSYLLMCTATLLAAVSCSDGSNAGTEKNLLSDTAGQVPLQINKAVLDEMIQTLPQPIEIAGIISKSKTPFSKQMLIPSEYASGYNEMYSQSLAFGAYGVDLGYINLNEKTIYSLEYLESIKDLSEKIKVDQFFDFYTLAEIAKNKGNADSLVQISTRNFNKIDDFLRAHNRGELSVLILVGAWIEGMHMFGEINKNNPSEDMETRIGEQKIVFDNVYAIINKLATIEYFNKMKNDLTPLKTAYDSVNISYEYREPEMKEVKGELVVVDKSETKVTMSPTAVSDIINQIELLRKNYFLSIKK